MAKKIRKPKEGDTVYLAGDEKSPAMVLHKINAREKIEYGFCVWSTSKLAPNKELIHTNHSGEFVLKNLTLVPPPFPTQITAR